MVKSVVGGRMPKSSYDRRADKQRRQRKEIRGKAVVFAAELILGEVEIASTAVSSTSCRPRGFSWKRGMAKMRTSTAKRISAAITIQATTTEELTEKPKTSILVGLMETVNSLLLVPDKPSTSPEKTQRSSTPAKKSSLRFFLTEAYAASPSAGRATRARTNKAAAPSSSVKDMAIHFPTDGICISS